MTSGIRSLILGFIAAGVFWLVTDRFFFESMLVPSSSMEPALLPNERVYLKKFAYQPVQRFDLVVIKSKALRERIVKRVVGLPGECIELKDSWQVLINGSSLQYADVASVSELKSEAGHHEIQLKRNPKFFFETKFGAQPLCLGKDEYYVLGDNRLASGDSRMIGPVPVSEIEGKMTTIWYSYDRARHQLRSDRLFLSVK